MRAWIVACSITAGLAPAQSESVPVATPDWYVPIHSEPADPAGGGDGIWAAGPRYKVSFHDGIAYYPVLGDAYPHNLPLTWRTESIATDRAVWIDRDTPATATHSEWRYEIRRGGVIEAYDVRRDGVEQTFTLLERPPRAGDLTVTGRIETELRATDTAPQHGALTFRDENGTPILEYGAAFAFDAAGDTLPMQTALRGDRIQLTVDGAWLRDAVYPVTLDPLTSTLTFHTGGTGIVDIARGGTDQMLRVDSRAVSASDYDLRGYLHWDNFIQVGQIFTDLTSSWSTEYAQVAYVAGATYNSPATKFGRFVIAMQRDQSGLSHIRVYTHDGDSTVLNSGLLSTIPGGLGVNRRHPSVGGTALSSTGTHALIAYESDAAGPGNALESVTVDASNPSTGYGHLEELSPDTIVLFNLTNSWPCVSRVSGGGTGKWVVAWEQAVIGSPARVGATRVGSDGVSGIKATLGHQGLGSGVPESHPKVAGRGDRFLLAYEHGGGEIRVQRFDWPNSAGFPTVQTATTLATGGALVLGEGRPIAYDSGTQSHWVIAYQRWDPPGVFWGKIDVDRVGYTGGAVESVRAYPGHQTNGGYHPSVCFNPEDREYPILWGVADGKTYITRMQYDSAAASIPYGASCAGTIRSTNAGLALPPYAGSEFLEIHLDGGRANALSVLFLSGTPASVQLPSGCFLDLGGALLTAGSGTSNASGDLSAGPYVLPDAPVALIGDLYWQWFQIDPATGGLVSSQGLQTAIR